MNKSTNATSRETEATILSDKHDKRKQLRPKASKAPHGIEAKSPLTDGEIKTAAGNVQEGLQSARAAANRAHAG
jgi:hypothetical protein